MKPVYEADSLHEAQMLVDLLDQQQIQTIIVNAHLQGALGELPLSLRPVVCVVSDADWARAVVIASNFIQDMERPDGPPRLCPSCGEENPSNFSQCWKCRGELLELRDCEETP